MINSHIIFMGVFLLFVFPSRGDLISDCHVGTGFDQFIGQSCEESQHLEWHAANYQQMTNAKCRRDVPYISSMKKYVTDNFSNVENNQHAIVNGIELKDENPKLVQHFKELLETKNDFIFDEIEAENQIDFQKKLQINPLCEKVLCAVEQIFGKEYGVQLLYLKTKYGLNASQYSRTTAKKMTPEEIYGVLKAVQDFPEFVLPIQKNKQFIRSTVNYGPRILANATISFFDSWGNSSNTSRQQTVFHEIAHYLGGELDLDDSEEWYEISGWIKTGDKYVSLKDDVFISEYGKTNPHEDFAETVTAYRYNPFELKKVSPKKYNFIKNYVFLGEEFTNSKKCPGAIPSIIAKAQTEIGPQKINQKKMKKMIQSREDFFAGCERLIDDYYFTRIEDKSELTKCLTRSIDSILMKEHLKQTTNLPVEKMFRTLNVLNIPATSYESSPEYTEVIDEALTYLKSNGIKMLMEKFDIYTKMLDSSDPTVDYEKKCRTLVSNYFRKSFTEDSWNGYAHANFMRDKTESVMGLELQKLCVDKKIAEVTEMDIRTVFAHVDGLSDKTKLRYETELNLLKHDYETKKSDFDQLSFKDKMKKRGEWAKESTTYLSRIETLENLLK